MIQKLWVWVDEVGEFRQYSKRELALEKYGKTHSLIEVADLLAHLKNSLISDEILCILNEVNWVSIKDIQFCIGHSRGSIYKSLIKLYNFGIIKYTYGNSNYHEFRGRMWCLV